MLDVAQREPLERVVRFIYRALNRGRECEGVDALRDAVASDAAILRGDERRVLRREVACFQREVCGSREFVDSGEAARGGRGAVQQ